MRVKEVYITQNFNHNSNLIVGSAKLIVDDPRSWHWSEFIRGNLALVPSFIKRPEGALEIVELSLVPLKNAMPPDKRQEAISKMPVTPYE